MALGRTTVTADDGKKNEKFSNGHSITIENDMIFFSSICGRDIENKDNINR